MAQASILEDNPQTVFAELFERRRGESVEFVLARMLSSWICGIGAMPSRLGLSGMEFRRMMTHHFPGYDIRSLIHLGREPDPQRLDEAQDLIDLLVKYRSGESKSELWLAQILAAGCFGMDHLWQDLGLWNRAELSALMQGSFAPLARLNNRDMKWKKFLYKRLCETEGIYTCRSPSCDVCADFAVCFGPEE